MTKDDIYSAMLRVGDAVRYIQKAGRNTQQNYSYVTDFDVRTAFHRELQRQGIVFCPSVSFCTTTPHKKSGERGEYIAGYISTLTMEITLFHGPSSTSYKAQAVGQGYDSTDKGPNKAYTSAIKNFLLTTFLVASGDDTERDEDDEPINMDAIEQAFANITKQLARVEPEKGAHKETLATILAHYKTASGRPVEHTREFNSRGDALQAMAALRQALQMWDVRKVEDDSKTGKAKGEGR